MTERIVDSDIRLIPYYRNDAGAGIQGLQHGFRHAG